MIFVTVGTHEQQFNRLVKKIDDLAGNGTLSQEIFIQRGFGTITPIHCKSNVLLDYQEMVRLVKKAEIVICHGGPGSIVMPLSFGKIPIVVPRQYKTGEHVNDHQVHFTERLEKDKKIIAVYDIEKLAQTIIEYPVKIKHFIVDAGTFSVDQLTNRLQHYCMNFSYAEFSK